ncbi:MAG: CocE/NonD family hydrolase, partial [bacterium]
ADGWFPVILERTNYSRLRAVLVETATFFAARGYVFMLQSVRGRYRSEGTWGEGQYKNEREDGYDTVEWIAAQSWCDGQVGTIGNSMSTQMQQALAVMNPPHLKAQFHFDGGYNYHTRSTRNSGACWFLPWLTYMWVMAMSGKEARANPSARQALKEEMDSIPDLCARFVLTKNSTPLKHFPRYEKMFLDVVSRGDYDKYWKEAGCNIEEFIDNFADVPVYLESSWYGNHPWGTVKKYLELSSRHESPKRLLMGAWLHDYKHLEISSGDVDLGPDSRFYNIRDLALKWFDHWLKGMKTDVLEDPPIRLFVMGGGDGRKTAEGKLRHGGTWRHENEWPIARTCYSSYYLHSDGGLRPDRPSRRASSTTYTFDPQNPVPTVGGNLDLGFMPGLIEGGGYDQRGRKELYFCKDTLPLASRPDVLVFETPALEQDIEVTGSVAVRLWVSSSCPDTDFTVKLIDVYPPNEDYPEGYALNLCDDIVRARYRNSREKAQLMVPGQIYEITLEPQPTSNLFKAGHRVRLDISSSNFPLFDVNPNTGGPLGKERNMVPAQNTVFHDDEHPSHIVLPVIPAVEKT